MLQEQRLLWTRSLNICHGSDTCVRIAQDTVFNFDHPATTRMRAHTEQNKFKDRRVLPDQHAAAALCVFVRVGLTCLIEP